MTRLLIIDDESDIAAALQRGLRLHGYDAVAENRADQALARLEREVFSGLIVDVMLGAESGIDLVRSVRAAGMSMPIVMLSALSDVEHRAAGLAAGADDYVVKPFSFDELVARLRVQEQRAKAQRPDPAVLSPAAGRLHNAFGSVSLTDRECDLLVLLCAHAGAPLSRGAIFDALWREAGSGNENVVDVYIGYLRKKLADANFHFEIKTIRSKGFVISGLVPTIRTTG